jgi:membrane-bound lytic murein transglycosylase D
VSDELDVPFSFWIPGRCFVVVPSALILRPDDLRMSLRHEAQHHRQSDTRLLYLCLLARAAFFWNPMAHVLARQLRELQEFACDEAIADRRKTAARDYCRCLLRVAEVASQRRRALVRTWMVGGSRDALMRRIEIALARPKIYLRGSAVAAGGGVAIALLAAISVTFATPIQDRRISLAQAERMVQIARQGSAFPVVMNEQVFGQLNLLLGTPDGRAFLRAGLARMELHQETLSAQIDLHGLPREMLALPLVESGYRNLPPGADRRHGAGLWQLIESTAIRLGLKVSESRDDRLNVPMQTDAAMRMLFGLKRHFGDWSLALLAYNAGVPSVEAGMRETSSRDAWVLIRDGHANDPDYLPRVMAAILVVRNPGVLD